MIKKLLLGALAFFVLVVVGFSAFVSLQPNWYVVERSTIVAASPATIFPLIDDFRAWDHWSPFVELDPDAKMTFSEPSGGKGAVMSWDGNDQVGAGTMKILDSKPGEMLLMEQEFSRPQQGKCDVVFELAPTGSETKVTWRFAGKYGGFVEKAICTVMNLDAMLGPKIEEGLAGIKRKGEELESRKQESSEAPPANPSESPAVESTKD